MRLWTIQTKAAWDYLQKHGVLRASRKHQSEDWPLAYKWMTDQLSKRVGPPPSNGMIPLWGWYQCRGQSRKRPDLRFWRFRTNPPGKYTLIECDLPDEHVVLSDYDAWHIILNEGFVSVTDDDDDEYYAGCRQYELTPTPELAEELNRTLYGSWERVIDMEALTEPGYYAMDRKSIQACFWEIKQDQIKSAKPFTSVGR
ncbi:DUF3841 domain-containing protein [Methyloligella solikamskensis]|uniref:DUF3841 domain-containing protein n=1 Tax=Methyloligella solikamskensis TaxID=1177756 RepID=A0ABW3J7Z7_9HYPH